MSIKGIDRIVEKLEGGNRPISYWLILYHLLAGVSLIYTAYDLFNFLMESL